MIVERVLIVALVGLAVLLPSPILAATNLQLESLRAQFQVGIGELDVRHLTQREKIDLIYFKRLKTLRDSAIKAGLVSQAAEVKAEMDAFQVDQNVFSRPVSKSYPAIGKARAEYIRNRVALDQRQGVEMMKTLGAYIKALKKLEAHQDDDARAVLQVQEERRSIEKSPELADAQRRAAGSLEEVIRTAMLKRTAFSNTLGMRMVWVEPGPFFMGTPTPPTGEHDETRHQVTLHEGFWMSQTEITQAQYERVALRNPSLKKGQQLPVENVTWDDAVEFCEKLTRMEREKGNLFKGYAYRLPTEARWEYACRYGKDFQPAGFTDTSWTAINSDGGSREVGLKKPNPLGLHDMLGNVAEWCSDWYGPYQVDLAIDPAGPGKGLERVIRGGDFSTPARECRASRRGRMNPFTRDGKVGFRVVLVSVEAVPKP